MPDTEIIQKLCTIHADVKNTNEKVNEIDEKVGRLDSMIRGNGTTDNIGIVAKVSENSKSVKDFKKIERKVAIIVVVLVVVLATGWKGVETLVSFFKHIP